MIEILKRARLSLLVLGGLLALVIGLSGRGGAELSWAAPVQNPYAQTIPTRIPEETSEPPPAPSPVLLTPTRQQTDNDNDNQAGETRPVPATPPARETSSPPADVAPTNPPESTTPAQPPAQDSGGEQEGDKPAPQPPLQEEGAGQILATPTSSPTPLPAATAADKAQATAALNAEARAGFLPAEGGAWWWVYALIAGVVLLGGGIALVKRA